MFAPKIYYIYKFNIQQIKENKIKIKKKDYIYYKIQQFDNQLFRIIRNITNNYLNNFIDSIIYIDTKGNKKDLESILKNGFVFNKTKFLYYGKNASMSRNGIIAFVDSKIIKQVDKYAMMDVQLDKVVLSKFESYKHLLMSSCHFIENWIPNIVIVKDFKKIIPNQHIKYVDEETKYYTDKDTGEQKQYKEKVIREGYKDIEASPADGSGIHSPEMGEFIATQIGLNHTPCLYQIRLPYCKGLSIQVNFKDYLKSHGVSEITDYWGNIHKIDDIDAIWTDNMFKGIKYFKDWNSYLQKFKEYNHVFGISKWNFTSKEEERYTQTNYQCLQTLDLPKEEFLKIADYSKQWVERILSGDLLYILKYLGKDEDSSKYIKAIRKNHKMVGDPAVQIYLKGLLNGFIKEMKLGGVWIPGAYKFLIPDLEAFMQHIGKLDVTGCLKAGEFYAKGLRGEYVIDRNPHITASEHAILNAVNNDFTKEYCKHLENVCMLNYHDITDKRLNGSDKDGDGAIVSNDKYILSGIHRDLPIVIDIDDKITTLEAEYTKENIVQYTLMSLGSEVGEISNVATCYLNKKPKDETWKQRYADNVCLLSVINGKSIDYAKTGVKWRIPYKIAKNSKPLPYFLKYKYGNLKTTNNSGSNMNHLAWNIEQWEKSLFSLPTVNSFELLYNDYIPFNHNKFNKILDLYERFNREYKTLKAQNKFIERVDGLLDDLSMWEIKNTKPVTSDLFEQYRQQAKKICPNEQELANYAVKIVYDLYPNRDKTFAWTIAEEGLLKNLKPDGKIYKVKSTQNREGTEYLGRWYKLEEL